MILHIVAFKNKQINAFTQPQYIDIEPEKAAIQLARSIKLEKNVENVLKYKDLDMYKLGTFDDETGIIVSDCDLLCKVSELVTIKMQEMDIKEEVKDDVSN